MKLHLDSILLGSMIVVGGASASTTFTCPLPDASSPSLVIDTSGTNGSLTLSNTVASSSNSNDDHLCLLSLLENNGVRKPVARSYSGRNWEVSAGPFAEILAAPVCDTVVAGECTFASLPSAQYVLTSYEYGGDSRVEAARFLEQTTFGPSLEDIEELASTANATSPSPNFSSWLTRQMSPSLTTLHRAYFRQHTNPRWEYPFYGAAPAATTPCSKTSRWRTFALTERDGVVSLMTYQNKVLHIEYSSSSGRYIWYVEGMARTSTTSLGDFYNVDEGSSSVGRLQTNVAYNINCGSYDNDISKYSCVGCPVRLCRVHDNKCDYIKNPAMDATGIEGTSRMGYAVVDLPEVNGGSGDMVGIDDAVEYQIMEYKKTGDEFWLNATIDQGQCEGMPDPRRPQASQFDESKFGMHPSQHMESALPTIMGRAHDVSTNQMITLAFDPILALRTNTVEDPIADGGGADYRATEGWYDGLGWTNPKNGRFDQPVNDGAVHCANVRRTFLNENGCKLSFSPTACTQPDDSNVPIIHNGKAVVVCGSPGETSNDFANGVVNGFSIKSWAERSARREIYKDGVFTEQKYTAWSHIALRSQDQLRQRVAWALYQIVPIGTPGGFDPRTEPWMAYYDVFVKNAFGSLRDVLKEVSFTSLMANWLSFLDNASIQYSLDLGDEIYPDENYAREIMQLFSIGLFKLNLDGTRQTDSEGNFLYTYNSDDIMSFARAWTGFTKQKYNRGNLEDEGHDDTVDPLTIDREKRDIFPKTNLVGGYIGDRYPLCADLPPKMHLRKGATYLVLGSNSKPEQLWEDPLWDDSNVSRLELDPSASKLYEKLCSPGPDGTCTYPGKVVLDENLMYDTPALQALGEHSNSINEVRTVRVTGGSAPVFYEYIQPPCVHKNFFDGAKKVISGSISSGGVVSDSLCANPSGIHAAASCCAGSTAGNHFCNYAGERMSFASAVETCMVNGHTQCDPHSWASSSDTCTDSQTYSWSSSGCKVRVKISFETSQVARVDYPDADSAGQRNVKNFVRDDTINYFRVPWMQQESLPSDAAECDVLQSCYSVVDGCICDTTTTDALAFATIGSISSKQDILDTLYIGALDPTLFDVGVYTSLGECIPEVQVYSKTANDCAQPLDRDVIFQLLDEYGNSKHIKNTISTVSVSSTVASFRNPVHFIDYMDRNLRDMFQETDAVLDSYFYHPSHAPFMALRFLQRLGGNSNPSPAYVERVAGSFKSGYYGQFGSGKYGDLGAMVAAALLDDESRKVVLDADQSHGQLREPLLKVFGLLRAMKADLWAPLSVPLTYAFIDIDIGQGPYRSPSVFSFFKPEFMTGSLREIGLVAPEAEVLQGGLITSLMDGMWSMMKFGLSHCYGGFQEKGWGADCPRQEGVSISDATATLTYEADPTASLDEVLNELALILTAGRLSESNRIIVRNAMQSTFSGNRAKAVRIAVQLIVSSPEFHSTNVARKTGVPMQLSGYTSDPVEDYKAIVYYYMGGGVDSFNVLVPMSNCKDGRNMYQEYRTARGSVALGTSDLLDIDATGSNQICDTFAVNKNYAFIQELYNAGKGLFVANAGVLNKPLTKHDNYEKDSKVQLFAHNHMTSENLKCDINDDVAGTGVGGRILDMLKRQGYQTSSNSVDAGEKMLKGFSLDNNPVWSVPLRDPTELDQYSSVGSSMLDLVKNLNGVGTDEDGFLGSTWSVMTSKALFEYEKSLEHAELFKSPEFDMSHYPETLDRTHNRFRSLAQYMKMRTARKVNREVFMLRHEGFDSHSESKDLINDMFGDSDKAIRTFVGEMERQGIWNNVVIVMGSEFGRSVSPNSNSGTDHGWGGNYFVLGGSLKGKQILGQYPEYLSKESDQWMSRGRIIPTTPWEYVWHGIAQWMGVLDSNDLSEILPNMKNFRKCDHFTDKDLFVDGQVPTYDCANMDEDNDGVIDDLDLCPGTLQYFVDNGLVDGNGCSGSFSPSSSSSPTISPTDEPTSNPTLSDSPTSSTLPFQDIGNNGLPAEVFPLGQCQGDCDNDIECQEGLLCFQRSNFELVPGCEGGDFDQKTDYCFKPTPNPTNAPTPNPTQEPTNHPIAANPTDSPTPKPTGSPTMKPTSIPTTVEPTLNPTTATPTTHPTTASPTTSPTTALPTTASPTTSTLPLQDIGNNGLPREVFPLGQCQGDCDNDGECQDGLLCLERNNFEQVPGCNGHESDQHTDFCIQRPANYYWFVGNNGVPASAFPMNACDGDCDNDAECAGDLECSPQEGPVPGCFGEVVLGKQYCFDPNPNPSEPTTAQPTNIPTPTGEPSREPTNPPITANPTDSPTPKPTDFPTVKPTPTAVVTPNPTNALTPNPTQDPTNPTLEGEELVYSVFDEGSQVTHVGCTDEHSSSNHVALDHQTEKFFCSKSGSESPGLLVSPSHGKMSLAKGLRVYAHNNCPGCDATSFILEGRKDPSENWAVISQGELSWTSEDRNARGQLISSTYGSGDSNLNYAEVSFPQKIALEYKLTFPTTRQTDEAIIQFAEVELPGKLLENIALQDVGNNGLPAEAFPLGQCQGDCDNDGECQGDLICYQRGNFDWVPGCTGHESNQKTDYCYGRPHENYLWFVGNNGVPASAFPMNACEGDCDNDGECAGELECRSRSGTEAVPGCEGAGISRKDYCYEPNA